MIRLPVAFLLLALIPVGPGAAQDLRYFQIATGSAASTYFPVGMAIATAISNPPGSRPCDEGGSCGAPGLIAVAQTSEGSVANVAAVANGQIDSGLAQADIVSWAYNGEGMYFRRTPLTNLRVIANLHEESVHLIVRKGAGIKSVRDLVGKRVSIDKPGSGTRLEAELILSAYGVRLGHLKLQELDPNESIDRFVADELDAFFLVSGYPAPAMVDLARLGIADLVPLSGRPADTARQRHKYFSREVIPAGTYEGIDEVATLSIGAQWVVAADADPFLIYQITKALWHPRNREILDAGHLRTRSIRLSTALEGVATPLHPGAQRYYREMGLLEAQ